MSDIAAFNLDRCRDNDFPLQKIDFSVSEKGKSVKKNKILLSFCCQSYKVKIILLFLYRHELLPLSVLTMTLLAKKRDVNV